MENVDEGSVPSEETVYTEYVDPKRDEWTTKIQPALKTAPLSVLVKACEKNLSRRELIELRAGRSKPHRKTRDLLFRSSKTYRDLSTQNADEAVQAASGLKFRYVVILEHK